VTTPEHPTTLGTYQVLRPLADLPTGRTLLGTDTTGRAVVLTLVHPAVAAGPGFRERFTAQARAAAAAPLWFVAAVVDVDAAADPPWRAEVHVAGSTLQQFVEERGPLGEAGTVALAERLAAGLAAVHAAGSAHGDLTPSTIVLAEEGPRLVGFGLASAAGPGYGTPGYQAPEAAAGPGGGFGPGAVGGGASGPSGVGSARVGPGRDGPGAVPPVGAPPVGVGPGGVPPVGAGPGGAGAGAAGDVFALGAVLAFAATGRPPFAGGSPAETRRRAAESEPDLAGLAEPVRSAVLACLRKNPAQRPTAVQAAGLLAMPADPPTTRLRGGAPAGPRTLVGVPPADPRVRRPQRRSSRGRFVALLAVAAAVLIGAVVAVVALTSRTGGTLTAAAPSATLAPVAPPTAAPTTGTLDPGTGATLVDLAPFGADAPRFTTPSRNISCQLTDTSPTGDGDARCDVTQSSWPLPPKPADCAGNWGGGVSVSAAEKAQLTCASDTVADPGLQVLPYGRAVSFGGILCDSQETGVRCVNRATGHGFRVARASFDLF
jgi:hypothetical protein